MTHTWRLRQVTPKPRLHPPPPDTPREGPYGGRPTLRRLATTHSTRTWTLGPPTTRIHARTQSRSTPPRKADTP